MSRARHQLSRPRQLLTNTEKSCIHPLSHHSFSHGHDRACSRRFLAHQPRLLKMRRTFAPPSSLARRILPILKPRRAAMSQRNPVEMRECLICAESKPHPRKFPAFSSCDHDANTCVDCYVQQAVVVVEQHHRWNAVTCPACNVAPPAGDLELILPRHEFRRLDDLVKKAALMQDPNWRWCLASGCSYGQIHNVTGGSRLIKCAKCNAKSCFHHQVTWHLGYTCDEYDESHPLSIVTKTDEETIKRITKSCPNCKWRIQKEGGCSHMVCTLRSASPSDNDDCANNFKARSVTSLSSGTDSPSMERLKPLLRSTPEVQLPTFLAWTKMWRMRS